MMNPRRISALITIAALAPAFALAADLGAGQAKVKEV